MRTTFVTFLSVTVLLAAACTTVQTRYERHTADVLTHQTLQPGRVLTEQDIAGLPVPVRRYLRYTGSIGRPVPQNMELIFNAQMVRKRGDAPMEATSEQVNIFGDLSRIFTMKAGMFLVPFQALHVYRDTQATFIVRVANLFTVVDIAGDTLTAAETVTVLNDLCVFAPARLTDPCFAWKEIDDRSAEVTLTNGRYRVRATLLFNEEGALVDFISDDRYALENDGTMRNVRWSTPISGYREFNGRMIPTYGEAIYHYPDGAFVYGTFRLQSLRYDVTQ
jgi:hypothetical protein